MQGLHLASQSTLNPTNNDWFVVEMNYVINLKQGYVEHEGNKASCELYVSNVQYLFGPKQLIIVDGAKQRDTVLKFNK